MACTEAPRGICYHRYRIDADGSILDARIVPPTSQNQARIEDDLRVVADPRSRPAGRRRCATVASRPSATTTRAFPARRISSSWRSTAADASPRAWSIGVGNPDRGDDAVGLHVARLLAARALPGVAVAKHAGDALALMDRWEA